MCSKRYRQTYVLRVRVRVTTRARAKARVRVRVKVDVKVEAKVRVKVPVWQSRSGWDTFRTGSRHLQGGVWRAPNGVVTKSD